MKGPHYVAYDLNDWAWGAVMQHWGQAVPPPCTTAMLSCMQSMLLVVRTDCSTTAFNLGSLVKHCMMPKALHFSATAVIVAVDSSNLLT